MSPCKLSANQYEIRNSEITFDLCLKFTSFSAMAGYQASDTMPKLGHVGDLREQWLVRADGALAHRLQDREISSHLCENRYRNQQIREDFPVALSEQQGLEHEARLRELARRRQADIDAEIAREMAEINLRRQRRQRGELVQAGAAHAPPEPARAAPAPARPATPPQVLEEIAPEELGLSAAELEQLRLRLEQEERDERLARQLSREAQDPDGLLADMRCAVEAQDGELARLLQEREYKKLQRAKEKARQKALLKKQQRLAAQPEPHPDISQATLCDAYSNPRDMIRDNRLRLCKSVDSDLNYVEPFEKEHIQSKASAIQSKEISKQYYNDQPGTSTVNINNVMHVHSRSFESDRTASNSRTSSLQHRQPPPPPTSGKKPRFPDPVSIRPASHYASETSDSPPQNTQIPHSYSENNNLYSSTFPPDLPSPQRPDRPSQDNSKRLSVISDITAEGLAKKKTKQAEMNKKRKGCKIQ